MSTIITWKGKSINIFSPKIEDIEILDIAIALGRICRWGGHTSVFYSVAEHSIEVSRILPDELKLAGLLHDSAEAYLGDLVSPFKKNFRMFPYRLVEKKFLKIIYQRFDIAHFLNNSLIHKKDNEMLLIERKQLIEKKIQSPLVGYSPAMATDIFLKLFYKYSLERKERVWR